MIEENSEFIPSFRLLKIDECVSTNTLALEQAVVGSQGNLWVVAKSQSAGKGSRGRSWSSLPGNLFASLLLRDPCGKQHLAELTFVAAVAVRKTLFQVLPDAEILLKWPNDILLNGKKCSGILLESRTSASGTYVAIGTGINCRAHPQEIQLHEATSLLAEGADVQPHQVFEILAREMAEALSLWDMGNRFDLIREQWLGHATGIGETVRVKIPGRKELSGIFAAMDAEGYMLLELSDKTVERISTADIFFVRPDQALPGERLE